MKKDYKKIKASLLLLSSGASGILGQTANNVSAVRNGNPEQAGRGGSTLVTNKSSKGFFNFLFKRGNTGKTNSDHEVENTTLQEKNSDSMLKREDSHIIIEAPDKKLMFLSFLLPILSPIFLLGTAVLSLAFNALTKVPAIFNAIFKTFKTGLKFGNKKLHQLSARFKKYSLSSFEEMIKRSHEERENKDKSYDTSQEKVYRNLDLAGIVVEKKGMRKKDYIKSTEDDVKFLQQIFKEYGLNYEGSKQNRRNFNVALEQLAILFCHNNRRGNSQQDESKFEDYFCTLNYEESKKEEEIASVKNTKERLRKADIGERFNKKGVIELLYDWSKKKDDMDDDLKIKIEKLYRIINEKYDLWKAKYKELSKLYDGVNSKLQTSGGFKFTVKKESFLKAKLKEFTRANYDLEYLIKILNEPQKYPILKEEFVKKIENLGIKYHKEFDNIIVNICETAKENEQIDNGEIDEEEREKYFELLKNVEKIAENENLKNEFYKLLSKFKGDLEQSEDIIHNECIGFTNYDGLYFLETISLVIPYISGENTDIINRIKKDKYSEEDVKTFFTANDPNCKKMEKIIINEMNNIEIMPLTLSIEDIRDAKFMSRIRDIETLTPEKILDILENNEKTAVDIRTIEKLLKWCEDNATDELYNKIKKIYENKKLQSQNHYVVKEEKTKIYRDLEKQEVKPEKTKYNEKDLEELFEKLASGKHVNLDLEEIAGTELILDPFGGEENFSKILLNIIKNGENVKIDNKLIEKTFFSNNVSEGKIIMNFLNWCKKNATEEYSNKLEKIYVKKEFDISGEYNKEENLGSILKYLPVERVESFAKFCEEMGKPRDYTKKVNRLKEAKRLGLTGNKKCSRDQFLVILKDRQDAFDYKYPLLREEIENSLKEFFSKSKAISHNTGVDGAIKDLVKWLEDGNAMDRDISWDPDTSKFLLDLVYKKIDKNYLCNRPGHKKVEDELKKLGANHGEKYSKDQMIKILKHKEQYPILYKQIENYTKRKYGHFMENCNTNFSKVSKKILKYLKKKKLDVPESSKKEKPEALKRKASEIKKTVAMHVIREFANNEVYSNKK